jgi:hypothetical protein
VKKILRNMVIAWVVGQWLTAHTVPTVLSVAARYLEVISR